KLQYPSIQIVQAQPGEFAVSNEDVVNVENGISNPNHHYETASMPIQTPRTQTTPTHTTPTHRIGVVNESIGTPPPSYTRSPDQDTVQDPHHHEQQSGGSSTASGAANGPVPTRTLFSSSVE
ncbi:hypothetical protein PENTCL1PPCAC_21781, partial [Pristionchus entomophagus]